LRSRSFIYWFIPAIAIAASALQAQTPRRTGPFVEVRDARPVPTRYSGDGLAGSAKPLSLATADFDEDGMPDLVGGYATGGGAGAIAIHRGNVDALWPYGTALRNGTPPAFLPDARVVAVPEQPDFLGAGDFDADGHWDIVTARLGSHALYLLRGDGHGGFAPPEKIDLPGAVTALATGEINRLDGLTDIAVGVTGDAGSQILVFESPAGALRGKPEVLAISAPAASLAMAALDGSGMNSLAVAAGHDLLVFHGRDRKLSHPKAVRDAVHAPEVTRQTFPFGLRALAAGRFTTDVMDLAVLGDDGKVHFFERPDADYQTALAAAPMGIANPRGGPPAARPGVSASFTLPVKPTSREMVLRSEVALPISSVGAARLTAALTSTSGGDDLVALDSASGQLHFLSRGASAASPRERAMQLAASLEAPGGAAAVLPMRLRPAALHALVLLATGQIEPVVAETSPPTVYTVTNTQDSGPSTYNAYNTTIPGSLRTAISNAYNNGGPSTIQFNIPVSDPNYNYRTGVFTIKPLPTSSNCNQIVGNVGTVCIGLPWLPAGCTIDGYTQPGGTLLGVTQPPASPNTLASGDNAVLKIQIDGSLTGQGPDGIYAGYGTSTVRGIIATGFHAYDNGTSNFGGFGVNLESGNNLVEGNFLGVNYNGAAAASDFIGTGGWGVPNTVGGTTPQARNLSSSNSFCNFGGAPVATPPSMLIEGNYFGTDATGKVALGGGGVCTSGIGLMFGGTTAGAGNLISGAGGIAFVYCCNNPSTPDSNTAQGNLIGTDVTGTAAVGNAVGAEITMGTNNLIGGTTPAARNIISGNMEDGVWIFNSAYLNTIQGNYIGTDVSGSVKLGNGGNGINQGIFEGDINAAETLIGGETAGAGNVISNNTANGILFEGDVSDTNGNAFSTTLGNLIGTDATGTVAMGNAANGILIDALGSYQIVGNTDSPSTNVIAFNGGDGVRIDPNYNDTVLGALDTGPFGYNTFVNNSIYSNSGAGIHVVSGIDNKFSQNSVYSNSQLGIAIDGLIASTCHSNTSGANDMQNAPVLTPASGSTTYISATATDPNGNTSQFSNCAAMGMSGGNLTINGYLYSTASTAYRVEFFQDSACDPSGYGQGKTFLTATSVTTSSAPGCIANFSVTANPTQADLAVTSSVSVTPYINQSYTYVIKVVNNGESSAANVVLTDKLSTGLAYTSGTPTQGSCSDSGATITCNLGTMRSGTTASVTMVVAVSVAGTVSDTATVTSSTADPNTANNTAVLSTTSYYGFPSIDHFNPASGVSGSGALPLVVYGGTFYQGVTTLTVNGTALTYTLLSNQTCSGETVCQGLSVTVPVTLTASPGTLTFVVTNPAPGGGTWPSTFTIYPSTNGVTQFWLSGVPNPSTINTHYTLTVTAQNSSGQTIAGYRGVVSLSGPWEYFYASPAFTASSTSITTYQFTAADNGVHSFGTDFILPGPGTITVSDSGVPTVQGSFTLMVNPGPPASLSPDATPVPMPIGFAFPATGVTVYDADSNPVPGVSVTFTAPTSGASGTFPNGLTTYTTTTDPTGYASMILTANQTVGANYPVVATVGSLTTQWLFTNTANVPAHLVVTSGNNQSVPLNSAFNELAVQVTDASNNPVQNIPVTFTPQVNNGATAGVSPAIVYSNIYSIPAYSGIATLSSAFANGVAGTYTITASVGSISVALTETNVNTPDPVAGVGFMISPPSAAIYSPFPSPIQATPYDASGNLLANIPVTFTVPSTGASAVLSATSVASDPGTGMATITATANGIVGTYNLTASAGGHSAMLLMTNTAATTDILSASGGTPQTATTGTAFSTPLQITLLDINGVPISGQKVAFSAPTSGASATLSSSTATTNSAGVASITATANATGGTYNVTASAPSLFGSANSITAAFALTNSPPTPASLTATGGTPQSMAAGAPFATALQATVKDGNGNPIGGAVVSFTAPTSGASATLSSPTASTNSSGVAQVTATANATTGSYSVTASIGGLSAPFALTNLPLVGKCDINADGKVNVVDVQLEINEALGVSAANNDLNGDGKVNVVDVQIVINAALGLGCSAT
jgi:uncharacterized repeat protein (TIGR01451 family)